MAGNQPQALVQYISHALALGALSWVSLPPQPVEALIAVSILVAAGHAVRSVFPGREAWVAAGFGLVHGLAFASTLALLHLEASQLALSLLGFNLASSWCSCWWHSRCRGCSCWLARPPTASCG